LTENLKASGWTWRELSVPEALRDDSPETRDRGWSVGFSRLIAQPSDRAQFRLQLAQLLQSASARNHERSSQSAWTAASPSHWAPTILEKLERWTRGALNAASIFCGLGFIAWVELRRSRARNAT
jgi:hypothetical protein